MNIGGLSKARLARMHDVMAGYVDRGEMPGLVTLISRHGEVHVDALGMKAGGRNDPMRRDTIFRIASMSKPITAAAAMILVEECKLRLDEPVDRLLPELAGRKVLKRIDGPLDDTVPAKRAITLRDLLTFRMGFGVMMAPPDTYPIQKAMTEAGIIIGPKSDSPHAPDEWIKHFGSLPLMHQPGEKWMYHSGSDVLGVLIARACGKPLETFFRERIFEPLAMNDTSFSVPAAKLDRLAASYQLNPKTGALEDLRRCRWQPVGPPSRLPGRWRRIGLDYRRLSGFRPDDAERGQAWKRTHFVEAFGRGHDNRPTHARAEVGVRFLPWLLGHPRLGVRRLDNHQARQRGGGSRPVRLGRRPGHFMGFGPKGEPGRDPDDPARLDFPESSTCLRGFLDLGLPGNRRLRCLIADGPSLSFQ